MWREVPSTVFEGLGTRLILYVLALDSLVHLVDAGLYSNHDTIPVHLSVLTQCLCGVEDSSTLTNTIVGQLSLGLTFLA